MTDDKVEPHLKNCPFCGSPQLFVECEGSPMFVSCLNCQAEGPFGDTRLEEVERWNVRDSNGQPIKFEDEYGERIAGKLEKAIEFLDALFIDITHDAHPVISRAKVRDAKEYILSARSDIEWLEKNAAKNTRADSGEAVALLGRLRKWHLLRAETFRHGGEPWGAMAHESLNFVKEIDAIASREGE